MFVRLTLHPAAVPVPTVIVPRPFPTVRLHRGDVRLLLRVGELRDRDGGQNADDHHHDQQLNEREALAVHLFPLLVLDEATCFKPPPDVATHMPSERPFDNVLPSNDLAFQCHSTVSYRSW